MTNDDGTPEAAAGDAEPGDGDGESAAGDADSVAGDADSAAGDGALAGESAGDAESQPAGEVPWTDLTDRPTGGVGMPPPSDAQPSEVVAGTTAFIEPAVYCEQCPNYDDESEACTNAGTDIRQTLPDGRFLVTECPVVTVDGPDFDRVQRD